MDVGSYDAKGIEGIYDLLCLVNGLEVLLKERFFVDSTGLEPFAHTRLSAPGKQ